MANELANLEVDDLIVLLLGTPSRRGLQNRLAGITRLEKLIFLLENETDLDQLLSEKPDFEPYNFGPFSKKVYDAVDTLAAAELIDDSSNSAAPEDEAWEAQQVIGPEAADSSSVRTFSLTARGNKYYNSLIQDIPEALREQLVHFKEAFAAIPLRQLVRYVYERYPAFTVNSLIRDDILGQ
jgi:hypothetical protein